MTGFDAVITESLQHRHTCSVRILLIRYIEQRLNDDSINQPRCIAARSTVVQRAVIRGRLTIP